MEKAYAFQKPPGLTEQEPRKKVVIVGAGPVGLSAALELANYRIASVVLESSNALSTGSKAICWSKRSLEIFDRLGIGERAVKKGVTWKVGRTYHGEREVFSFDLLPEEGHKRPAFINLQQYYVEQFLIERASESALVDLRFSNTVTGLEAGPDSVRVQVETQAGAYHLEADWLIACDGVRSPVRGMMGLGFEGEIFEDRFLITDIEMNAEFPSERRFWFEPTFHNGQSALLHKQPDNIYRIDLQLGPEADPQKERQVELVEPRIKRVVGARDFRIEWVSVYTFQCRRMARFVHGRVLFAGDAAHVVSPFGARGGNGGLQDVDCLCWRLAAVVGGRASESVLEDYNSERTFGADENIANSTRTTKFMSPADGWERTMRDQLLRLAAKHDFARAWVNSGRLSVPCIYPVSGPDDDRLADGSCPGAVLPDAPLSEGWLLDRLGGRPAIVGFGCEAPQISGVDSLKVEINDFVKERFLGRADSAVFLIRPDQVVAARWTDLNIDAIRNRLDALWRSPD